MKKLIVGLLLIAAGIFAAEKPNVVIFFTDDQGTLDINCYGAKDLQTPNMDHLAKTGVRFTQAYAHTVCCPSRAGLMTGRHPQRGGVSNWTQGDRNGSDAKNSNMFAEEITIAEALKAAGYDTALFGKWHLGAKQGHGPLEQGFDRFFGHYAGFIDNYRHCFLHGEGYHDLQDDHQEIFRKDEYYPDMMVGKAMEYLDQRKDNPFLMVVCFNLPHYPEQPTGKFANAYPDMEMPRQSYARVVSTVDDHIGRIVNKLEANGLRDDTIIIFMSDNGHSTENNSGIRVDDHVSGYPKGHYYSAHGGGGYTGKWIGNKGTFLEGGLRVPAIISYPKALPQGVVRDQAVTVMDWLPTILELAGIPKPDVVLDGRSMLPVIRDAAAPSAHPVLHFQWSGKWAVRQGDWKLIAQQAKKPKKGRKGKPVVKMTLHNLADKQPEVKDYAKEHPEIVRRLQKLHNAWIKEVTPK
ncbi:MAG: sulfatase [Syntrophobacterales bacterium]|nr:MAG: sulfatase [Syntrophobacterales bacterium]